jgi:predicted DNA-binding transcriptional regulator AlpA
LIIDNDIKLYTVKDVQEIFKLSKSFTYRLMNQNDFPTMRIGSKMYVTHNNLVDYLKQNGESSIELL